MSERAPVRGVLIAHGAMANGLADAVRQITGAGPDALVTLSNLGLSPAALAGAVRTAAGGGPAIIFADLPSGSCGFAARLLARERADLVVICGVNLPMLLEFVTHRELPLEQLVPRLLSRARAAIMCAPADYEQHVDPAVSRG
jgi:mannose/fructose-specific phosphotransferase system component IIA